MTSQGTRSLTDAPDLPDAIAVTGLMCRFPGAPDAEAFWANLVAGRDSITFRTPEELAALGVPADRLSDPRFVPAGGVLDGMDEFDAEYFGITPRDAALMDPQHRLLLQGVVSALEDAGQPTRGVEGGIGVYASAGFNSYLTHRLLPHAAELADLADMQWLVAGEKDYLATQTSYRLGLTGPSLSVQTACSSALVAVHLASEALLSGECDVAVAGAVSAGVAQGLGYLHTEGGILSPDGHCRPFDEAAGGTVFGCGVGVVVLKRLADAVADGDTVRAVLLGSAVNNDGDRKVGFTAPGLEGQVRVIGAAQSVAGIGPEDISCVEAHGTATPLGDRIELAALDRVFADAPDPRRVLGAVKSNVGHLDTCAGMAGLIKTILALEHRTLLPTAHFENPSPGLDRSRFRVLTEAEPWSGEDGTRTAGVSSFGIGGTNTHVILRDAPSGARRAPGADTVDGWQVLPTSARTPEALDRLATRLEAAVTAPAAPALADAAHTLQTGRTAHPWRRAVTAAPGRTAALATPRSAPVRAGDALGGVALLYPGQGAGTPGMAAEPYATEPVFRAALDRCLEALSPWTDAPLRDLLLDPGHANAFDRTEVAQPALFAVEYALTEWWTALGVRPVALAGHSVGELTAACAAGVFTLADAARLVARRGELMSRMPAGAMLAVPLPEAELRHIIDAAYGDAGAAPNIRPELAAVNAPDRCVAAGEPEAVERLRELLAERGVAARPLDVRHAFHSRHADGLLEEFAALVAATPAQAPRIPVVSGLTGRPLTPEEATSPAHWTRQLRETVRFADALRALPETAALIEAGPGTALSGFARRTLGTDRLVLPTLGRPRAGEDEPPARLTAVARLWERGTDIDWTSLGRRAGLRRVPLPTYPFERTRHWFEPSAPAAAPPAPASPPASDTTEGAGRTEDRLHVQAWSPSVPPAPVPRTDLGTILLLADASGLADEVAAKLVRDGARVHLVRTAAPGLPDAIAAETDGHRLDPEDPDAFRALAAELESRGTPPDAVVSCWAVDDPAIDRATADVVARCALRAVTVPAALARALGERFPGRPLRMLLVSDAALAVNGRSPRTPHAAAALGPARVLPLELPGSAVRALDLDCAARSGSDHARAADAVLAELAALIHGAGPADPVVAVRGRVRLVPEAARPALDEGTRPLAEPPSGAWLITGGLGGIGTAVATRLADRADRHLVLVTRRPVPDGPTWHTIRPKDEKPASACPPELARTLTALSANGSEVCLVQCDVTDERSLGEALDRVRERYGRINGVVHAAGLPGGGVLTLRRAEDIARVLEPKVLGTVLLHRLTERDRPVMVLCSSVLAVAGVAGQADYTGANAFLDSFAHTTDTAVAIGWDRWSETGMAVRSSTVEWKDAEGEPLDHELFDARRDASDGWAEFRLRRGPHTAWLSLEHRLAGEPVLPGTALLDLALAAHRRLTEADNGCAGPAGVPAPVQLDAVFTSPVRLAEATPPVVVVRLRPHPEGGHDWEVRSSTAGGRPHGQGRVRPYDGPAPQDIDLEALRASATPVEIAPGRGSAGLLTTGPRWDCVTQTRRGVGYALLTLRLPERHHDDVNVHPLHPALLDAATGAIAETAGRHLPVAYRKLILHRDLSADGYARIVPVSGDPQTDDTLVADVTLTDAQGRPAVTVEGFVLRTVSVAPGENTPGENTPGENTPGEEPAPVENGSTRDGITTGEGLSALDVILANPHLPHVLVTPRVRAVSTAPRTAAALVAASAGSGAQDALPADPAGRIAQVWARMLGLPGVGPDDNLFELGADSLTIVQIAAEMRNAGLAVSPGDLFAHPTAAALADRLGTGQDSPPEAAPPAPAAPAETPGHFPDADLSNEDLAQVLNLFRSGQDTQ
ncbi:type I polyketide synthase [Streptomyces sp. RerS4]|uniref:type I polyketide synthase n=1 Tax=Streptomyces sp. RerS4 TaxID=2942449 RepID=UPI00201BB80B|nr:type I polyketide synthase [Streptomyces sp. RerS4]UQW99648.1 SDR family NAD(P)-dependent oxidoreductase [Streptomyces sp. RerS4]